MQIRKSRTGIQGLDELTGGGLPLGRPTLISGGAGCGKTLMSMEYLIHGALEYGEPGVFMAFEETALDLTQNISSLGYDLDDLVTRKMLLIDYVRVERSEVEESGEYDLEGLFIRLNHAIDSIGAKRVVLDTLESLFSGLPNPAVLRAELRRLFRWLKDKGVTVILTGERGTDPLALTRHGIEEYVSDCVIVLDHRVSGMVSSRRLRVVKYRGSTHGTNEYPFLINDTGISIVPITSLGLKHEAQKERVPTGVSGLDEMMGGEGFFRGSSILVSGTAGTGKSSLAAHFVQAACQRGERVLYFAFEESASQIIRNMGSIGIDLAPMESSGLLHFHASRPSLSGLEMHLATMFREINTFKPDVVVVDPLNSFVSVGNEQEVNMMLLRLVDHLKSNNITGFFTCLTSPGGSIEKTDVAISSLVDTWLLVMDMESGGERNRGLYILKSRGMPHSNQIREFTMSNSGVVLRIPYTGPAGVLTGAARVTQEAQESAEKLKRELEIGRKQKEIQTRRLAIEAKIEAIRADFLATELVELNRIDQDLDIEKRLVLDHGAMGISRSSGGAA